MILLSVSMMIGGAIIFIPCVLGKDSIVELAEVFDQVIERRYIPSMLSIGIAKVIFSIFLLVGSVSFWHYWSKGAGEHLVSLLAVYFVSIFSLGLTYLTDHLLLNTSSTIPTGFRAIIYITFFIFLLGSIGVIWIPIIVYIISRLWKLLVNIPLLISGAIGYLFFMAGLFWSKFSAHSYLF